MKRPETALIDAGPVIHLAELGLLSILNMFEASHTTIIVYEEIQKHIPELDIEDIIEINGSTIPYSDTVKAVAKIFSLDAGEISLLSMLVNRFPSALFVCDDSAARLAADALKIESTGTLGIVIRAGTEGIITRTKALDALRLIPEKTSLYISEDLLTEVISKTERAWS
jgi:predicted nucleic acid-binding protein